MIKIVPGDGKLRIFSFSKIRLTKLAPPQITGVAWGQILPNQVGLGSHHQLKQRNTFFFVLKRAVDYTQIVIFCYEYQYVNVLFEIVFAVFDYYCFEGHRED